MNSEECKKCGGRCCVGTIEVFACDEIYNDSSLVKDLKEEDYDKVMITDNENKCIALRNGLCMIYDKRPSICRDFEFDSCCCNRFRHDEIKNHTCQPCQLVFKRRLI